jgi:SPX domain protein involved in polyphosphate accumulation
MRPDEHGNDNGRYALASLYYDSPELRCYWEKEYGLRFRRKLRLRRYETGETLTEETPIFVEIKQRVDRVTQKRRAVLPYGAALRLCNERQMPEYAPEDKAVIEEIYVFLWQYNLRPVSIVRYDRQAFVGSAYDLGLRVTFDTNLNFQAHPLHLHEVPQGLPILPANQVVLEIKVNERIPSWLTGLIADHNLRLERVSKYCRSIETAQKMPALRWRNLPPESAAEALTSVPAVYRPVQKMLSTRR